ncbi:hypothetical protein MJT46_001365 [Ovis ammon polii x Ovis aries]|nr:hypothetical protein MJT46_001365 [Ovis ammon polii x Ovis aries]
MLQQPQRGLYRERRPPPTEKAGSAPSLIPPLRTAPPGPFHPYPYERRAKEPKVTAPTSVLFSCKVKERSHRVLTEGEIKAPAVPSPRVSFTSSRKANCSGQERAIARMNYGSCRCPMHPVRQEKQYIRANKTVLDYRSPFVIELHVSHNFINFGSR